MLCLYKTLRRILFQILMKRKQPIQKCHGGIIISPNLINMS